MSPAGEHGEDLCWMKLAENVFQIKSSLHFFVLLQFIYIVSIRMIYLATSSRGKERLQRPQFSKSFVGWLEPGHKIMVMVVMMEMMEMMVMVVMVVMMVMVVIVGNDGDNGDKDDDQPSGEIRFFKTLFN